MDSYSCRSAIDQCPVEVLVHIFSYLRLDDRKNIRLTCSRFYDVCNLPKFIDREEIILDYVREANSRNAYHDLFHLASSRRRRLNVQFIVIDNAKCDATSVPKLSWELVGPRIHSLRITTHKICGAYCPMERKHPHRFHYSCDDDVVAPDAYLDNSMASILFHCRDLKYLLMRKEFTRCYADGNYRVCIYNHSLEVVPVANESATSGLTIRALENQCSCTPSTAKEIYASYRQNGRVELETIQSDAESETGRYRYLLGGMIRKQLSLFEDYLVSKYCGVWSTADGTKYLGVRIGVDVDCARLEFLRMICCLFPELEALVVRFDSTKSENEISNQFRSIEDQDSYAFPLPARLQHLTVYGGCRGMLRIFESFQLPHSLKHLDVYAPDVQSTVQERDDESNILSALEYVATNVPNLEILRVDNASEWIHLRTTSTHSTSSFAINEKDHEDLCRSDVCRKFACCKLSSVGRRFRDRNYAMRESRHSRSIKWPRSQRVRR